MKVRESNRFELEQDILNTWKITDDLEMLCENVMEDEHLDKDKVANALIGLQTIYGMRFERMWNTFEDMIHKNQLDK